MEVSTKIERCETASGERFCVLIKGHDNPCYFRKVPTLREDSLVRGEPLWNVFCPYCGSRPMLEGPGCEKCGGGPP